MALTPGTRLGVYQITAPIGEGGMGEVYRAHDTTLDRDVAIKVLPEAFATDVDRVARLQREAKTLAALNHPHIAAIYGLEQANSIHALVMELVDGEDLAQRISRGPIPLEEALPIARQIADALEAAHEQGIVHRDLKPANIRVRPDGTVKVLDFGLAKARDPAASSTVNVTMSPTLSLNATMAGMILGTAAYMSPEQARGKPVDKRADVWAFGAVLFEMLTGSPPFPGDDISHILARVIDRDPDWSALPPALPPVLGVYLRRCLVKDPRQRIRDIGDVRLALEGAFNAGPAATDSVSGSAVAARRWTGERLAALAAVLTLLAVSIALAVLHFRAPAEAPELRTEITTPAGTDPVSFALSPDGRRIVFVAAGDGAPRLWLRPLDVVASQPLPGTEGANYPFWSPDSRSVGFFAGGKLKRVEIAGGLPQSLADAAAGRGGAWSADGTIVFAPSNAGPLFRIPASGGSAAAATKEASPRMNNHRFPQFLPGGRQFLFYAEGDDAGIYLGSLDSTEAKRLNAADAAGVYMPSGWLLFIRQGTLAAQRLNVSRAELSGDSVMVADNVIWRTGRVNGTAGFSFSPAGLVAYRTGNAGHRQLTWFDRSGKALDTLQASDTNSEYPELSPDGRRVAMDQGAPGSGDVWLMDATRTTRFTLDASANRGPIWSPDGSRIVYRKQNDLYEKPSSGAGEEKRLAASPQAKFADDWSADGRFLLYSSSDPKTGFDLWVLPLEKDGKPQVFLNTRFNEAAAQFSPDGRWVAYQSDESGRYEVDVRAFPGPAGQWQVSTSGGVSPRWRADGKELYYVAPDGRMMAASITVTGTAVEAGTPAVLFQPQIVGGGASAGARPQYDVARDGRFLIIVTADDTASPITLLQHWKPPAK